MKRIRNIRDLEYEKLKLRVKQRELEKRMERSWKELTKKLSLEPPIKSEPHNNAYFKSGNPFLSNVLNYGANFLSHQLGVVAGKKIEGLAEQVLEKISGKINNAISRKKRA